MTTMTFTMPSLLMPDGQDVALFPMPSELTIAQAAKYLDGTEGLVKELLEDGLIKYRLKNGEHLVQWDSLVKYQQEWERGHAALDELFRMFYEAGMSDDYD